MTNAEQTTDTKNTKTKKADCPVCGKVFEGPNSKLAASIHRAKAHNKKNVNSAKDLLTRFKENRKNQQEKVARLDDLIHEIEFMMDNGK